MLNLAAAPLALVFSAVLVLFISLKGDFAKLEVELGKKTDALKDDLKSDLKSGQTTVLGVLSLLTLFTAYIAFAALK